MKRKQKYIPHLFPGLFFILGALFNLIIINTIYFLLILWFNYELMGFKNET